MSNISNQRPTSLPPIARWTCAIAILIFAGGASAACRSSPAGPSEVAVGFPSPLVFPRDAAINSVIATTGSTAIHHAGINCDSPGSAIFRVRTSIPSDRLSPDKATIILGDGSVGIQFFDRNGTIRKFDESFTINFPQNCSTAGTTSCYVRETLKVAKLIKLKNSLTSTYFLGEPNIFVSSVDGIDTAYFTLGWFEFQAQTCTATQPPPVNLGTIKASSFTGVGATSPPTPFSISINCAGVQSAVSMVVTDQQAPSNTSSTLGLSNTSTAAGVGVQILFNNTPVKLGPDSSLNTARNRFQVFTSDGSATVNVVSLAARYVQTATSVKPGTVSALATFTLSYQ